MEQNKTAVTQFNPGVGFVEKMITAVESFEKAKELGQFIINSGFAPKHFEGKPEAVVLAIDAGRKLGFDWFQALQEGFIVNGIPGYKARALKALVMASGLCEMWETTFQGAIEKEDRSVTIRFKRKGGQVQERVYNVEMAKRAGLWGKKKKYDNKQSKWVEYEDAWCKHPDDMMEWKCVSRVLNEFPDVCKGFKSVEELSDIAAVEEQEAVVVTENGISMNPKAPESTEARTNEVLEKVKENTPVLKVTKTTKPPKDTSKIEEAQVITDTPPNGEPTLEDRLNAMKPVDIGNLLKEKVPFSGTLFERGLKKNIQTAKQLLIAESKGVSELEQVLEGLGVEFRDLMFPESKEETPFEEDEKTDDAPATITGSAIEFGNAPRDMAKCAEIADYFEDKKVDLEVIAEAANKDVMAYLTDATKEELEAALNG